jgi:hypothetical protein
MLNILHIKDEGAELDNAIEKVMQIINLYPEIFPHLHKQGFKLKKYFSKGGVILEDGVVITFSKYRNSGKLSRNATAYKKAGDFILHQIATDGSEKGATKKVLDKFVSYCKENHAENLFLTVRAKNDRAVKFYERYGFERECGINWHSKKDGVIPGIIFRLKLVADKNIETVCNV